MPKPKPKPKIKPISKFVSEALEQEFWATADTTEYFDWERARRVVFPNLKPSTTPISMRLPATRSPNSSALPTSRTFRTRA